MFNLYMFVLMVMCAVITVAFWATVIGLVLTWLL